jgi:hypothetical protein
MPVLLIRHGFLALSKAGPHLSVQLLKGERLVFSFGICSGVSLTMWPWLRQRERNRRRNAAFVAGGARCGIHWIASGYISAPSEAVTRAPAAQQQPSTSGSIHIEFPNKATISVGHSADPVLLRSVLESLQVIELRTGTKIWIAAGVTDMRRGFQGLSAQVHLPVRRRYRLNIDMSL